MNRILRKSLLLSAPLLCLQAANLSAQTLVSLDFDTPGQFSNNFRFTYDSPLATTVQTSNYVSTTATAFASQAEVFVYDTTPSDSSTKNTFGSSQGITISAGIRAGTAASSFGFVIINPANEAGTVQQLALFNWDISGVNDQLRIFTGSQIVGGSTAGSVAAATTGDSGASVGASSFTPISLTYRPDTVDPTRAVFNLTVGTLSTGNITLAAGTYMPNFEVGIRSFDGGTGPGSTDFDNFTISQVPEPSICVLFGVGLSAIFVLRRFRTGLNRSFIGSEA